MPPVDAATGAQAPVEGEAAPVIVEAVAPAAGEPASPLVVEPAIAPVSEAPPAEPAAVAESKPELKPHTDTPSLLEAALKPEGEKPAEAKPEGEKPAEPPKPEAEKPVDGPQAEVKEPDAPVVYDLKVPEGFTAVPEVMSAYTDMLGVNKIAPEVGQLFLDLHTQTLQKFADELLQKQHDTFAETRKGWTTQVMADEMIGGSGFNTAIKVIAEARDRFISDAKPGTDQYAKDMKEFNDFLAVTGAGDHPVFLKALYRVGRAHREPSLPPPNAKPTPQNGVDPSSKRGLQGMYRENRERAGN